MLRNVTTPSANFRVGELFDNEQIHHNSIIAYLPEILRNLGEIVREFRFFDDKETVLIRLN